MTDHPTHLIGFSYSLMPDGTPGWYNEVLAKQLTSRLELYRANKAALPQVALQWEIADALGVLNPHLTHELSASDKLLVVQPPDFLADDLTEGDFDRWIANTESDDARILHYCLDATQGRSIIEQLNRLLGDATLYEKFEGLELDNFVRTKLGELFTEYRALPIRRDFPLGLQQYQRRRINRLIIERIVDSPLVMPRARYLSTRGVVDHVFDHFLQLNQEIETVGIIAHPLHAPRCVEQTKRAISIRLPHALLSNESPEEDIDWDRSTAQVWCRSLSNWLQYERIVKQTLKQEVALGLPEIPNLSE